MRRAMESIVALLFLSTLAFAQAGPVYGSNPDAGHYVRVNGIELYYEVYGHGHPLLLMHGNGGSIYDLRYQIPEFAKYFRVIAVDSRAQGRSSDSDAELTFTLMASDMAALLDSLHVDSAYVVGWSDGAIVGLKLALDFPDKVAKLVSDAANFVADSTALPEEMLEDMRRTTFATLDSATQKSIVAQSHFPKRAAIIFDKLNRLDLYHPNFTIEQLRSIETPTLVMAGDHDLIKEAHTLRLFHSLPHARLCIIPGVNHSLLQEKPRLANRIIIDFLESAFTDMK